jgi:RNA polymerase sigma-70 factor (ECF subfamily)
MQSPVPRPDSEETVRLLDLARRGDPDARNDLLARHRDELRTFVEVRLDPAVRARVDASDVVQEALAEADRRLSDYLRRRPMPFHLWVRKTAYERLLNARRDHKAARRNVGREATAPDESSLAVARSLVSPGPTPSEVAQANELADRVAAAVAGLREDYREILLMRLVDNLPYDEIEALLEISQAAARQRFGRALIRLKEALVSIGVILERT